MTRRVVSDGAVSALDNVHGKATAAGGFPCIWFSCRRRSGAWWITLSSETKCWPSPRKAMRGVDGLHRAHRVAFDAGLHQAADGVAGQAEVVFHADFGGVST